MAYLIGHEEMDPKKPFVTFASASERIGLDGGKDSLYLPFSYITENEDLLTIFEGCLGFDYYGTVIVFPEDWENFVQACEENPDCEIATDLMDELSDWVAASFEECEKFYLIGL